MICFGESAAATAAAAMTSRVIASFIAGIVVERREREREKVEVKKADITIICEHGFLILRRN